MQPFCLYKIGHQGRSDQSTYRCPRELAHQLLPLLGHGDGLLLEVALVDGVALLVGVVHDCRELALADGVHDGEEVLLVALPAFVELRRHVRLDHRSIRVVGVERLDRDLRVVAHVDRLHLRLLEQLLLAGQDQADPLLRQAAEGRRVELNERKGQMNRIVALTLSCCDQ